MWRECEGERLEQHQFKIEESDDGESDSSEAAAQNRLNSDADFGAHPDNNSRL